MNSLAFVAAFAFLACTSASAIFPSTRIIEGPSSRTTVVGSDGSVIDSVNPGGKIISSETPAVVAHTAHVAPVVSSYAAPFVTKAALHAPVLPAYAAPYYSAYTAPAVTTYSAYSSPAVAAYSAYPSPVVSAYSSPVWPSYPTPFVSAYSSPVVASGISQKDTVISGPSGHIATSKTVAGPAVVAHGPALYSHGLYH